MFTEGSLVVVCKLSSGAPDPKSQAEGESEIDLIAFPKDHMSVGVLLSTLLCPL